jgi:hypothetical protein
MSVNSAEEIRILRRRHDELVASVSAPLAYASGAPAMLALTTTLSTYPTAAQSYFACLPLTLLGTEVEGGPGTVTPGSATFFALNIGSTIPPAGTQVFTTFVGNRWVFRYDA